MPAILTHLIRCTLVATCCFIIMGCSSDEGEMIQPSSSSSYGNPSIQFVDTVQTNVQVDIDFLSLVFMDVNGDQQQLKNVFGKKNTIVVVTRGFAGSICPYCTTQTSRLISNYAKFTKLDAEVVVVYPMQSLDDRSKLDKFLKSTRRLLSDPATPVPFPILLDVGLNVVGQLGIRHDLSKPATYILGKNGQLRFAYVGSGLADRPSIKAMLEQSETLKKEQS